MRCVLSVLILTVVAGPPDGSEERQSDSPPSYEEAIESPPTYEDSERARYPPAPQGPPPYEDSMLERYPPAHQVPPQVPHQAQHLASRYRAQRHPDLPILQRRDATLGMPLTRLEAPQPKAKSVWGAVNNVRRWAISKIRGPAAPGTELREVHSSGPSSFRRSRSVDDVLDRPVPSAPEWTEEEFYASPYAPHRQTRLQSEGGVDRINRGQMEFSEHQPNERSRTPRLDTRRHDNRDLEDIQSNRFQSGHPRPDAAHGRRRDRDQSGHPRPETRRHETRHDNRDLEDIQSNRFQSGHPRPDAAHGRSRDRIRHINRDGQPPLLVGGRVTSRGRHDHREAIQSGPSSNTGRERPRTAQQIRDRNPPNERTSRSREDTRSRSRSRDNTPRTRSGLRDRSAADGNPQAERRGHPITSRPSLYNRRPAAQHSEQSLGANDVFEYTDPRNKVRQVRVADQHRLVETLSGQRRGQRRIDREHYV